jgi:hypothetical protein
MSRINSLAFECLDLFYLAFEARHAPDFATVKAAAVMRMGATTPIRRSIEFGHPDKSTRATTLHLSIPGAANQRLDQARGPLDCHPRSAAQHHAPAEVYNGHAPHERSPRQSRLPVGNDDGPGGNRGLVSSGLPEQQRVRPQPNPIFGPRRSAGRYAVSRRIKHQRFSEVFQRDETLGAGGVPGRRQAFGLHCVPSRARRIDAPIPRFACRSIKPRRTGRDGVNGILADEHGMAQPCDMSRE